MSSLRVGYYGSNECGFGILGGSINRGFQQLGISFLPFNQRDSFDYVLIFNSSSHIPVYTFEGLDNITGKFAFIDMSEYGWWAHNEKWKYNHYSAFAPKTIEVKPKGHQKLIDFLRGKSYPFFIREYYKGVKYHNNYYPIDYVLEPYKTPVKPTTFEEYKNREWDVFTIFGESHPSKRDIVKELNKLPFRIKAVCGEKISQEAYLAGMGNARFSISYDGFGSGGFRDSEIMSRTCYLKNSNKSYIQRGILKNNLNFIEYEVLEDFDANNYPKYKSTNINSVISHYMNNLNKAYEIYEEGYKYFETYYTELSLAKYIIDTLIKHDYNVVTPEEVTFL